MRLEPLYLILAMLITIAILYAVSPTPEIIIKYPDISQVVSETYVDDQGVCYRYHRVEV